MLRRAVAFLKRHKKEEEGAAVTLGVEILWTVLRRLGIFGAGVAAAAVFTLATSHSTYHPSFSLSTKGAAFITRNEGVRYGPYNDPYNCTVGVGHLVHHGPCTAFDYAHWRISPAQAQTLLLHDAGWAENAVRHDVTFPIKQYQFDALVDLTFNIGAGGFHDSSILRYVNIGDWRDLAARWPHFYVTASGHYLAGLVRRREVELHLFLTGDYGSGIGHYVPPKPATAVPKPVPNWAWRWVEWRFGRGPYKHHALDPRLRPHGAPSPAQPWEWKFLTRFK